MCFFILIQAPKEGLETEFNHTSDEMTIEQNSTEVAIFSTECVDDKVKEGNLPQLNWPDRFGINASDEWNLSFRLFTFLYSTLL